MSWDSYDTMRCNKCGNVYEIENSTLIMCQKNYDKCPLCNSEGEVISSSSILSIMNQQKELFELRKKRFN